MNNDKNDKNRRHDSYDRRPVVDTPTDKKNAAHAASVKRKGFYIILLLGITAIGIYAVISSLTASNTAKKNNNESRSASAVMSTSRPREESVPANAPGTPVDESEPMTADEINAQNASASPQSSAAGASERILGQAPVSGKIVKDFSDSELIYSNTMKDWRTHAGVDIAANMDTPVTAVKDGVLKKVYEDSLFGTTVIIHHDDDGTDSVYSNLKDATSDPIGTPIKKGDVLGKVGKTAVCETEDEPHLHFEIKVDDSFLDPKEFVKFEEVDYLPKETSDSAATLGGASSPAPSAKTSAAPSASPFETAAPYDYGDEDEATIYID